MNSALFIAVIFSVLVFFLTSVAVFITRKRSYRMAPVVVTSATHSAQAGYAATQMSHAATMQYQAQGTTKPYITHGFPTGQTPVDGCHRNATTYTTMGTASGVNPPSYSVAVNNEKQ